MRSTLAPASVARGSARPARDSPTDVSCASAANTRTSTTPISTSTTTWRRLGAPPEPDLIADLYRPTLPHQSVPAVDGESPHRTWRIRIDDVPVRFEETSYQVRMVVEGQLAPATVDTIVDELRQKLEALERCSYDVDRL